MRSARPILCMVTSGQCTTGMRAAAQSQSLVRSAAEAAAAGVDLIYLREPGLDARALCALASALVSVTRGSSTRVVVGARADVALAAGADGVHLPATGPSVERVRRLAPLGWLVGRSAHSPSEVAAAATADYIVFGTVFASASKPGLAGQGLAALSSAVARVTVPVLAIGGMTVDRVEACLDAGASGIAAISLFAGPWERGTGLSKIVRQIRRSQDAD